MDTVSYTHLEEYKNDNKPCSEEAWADLKAKAVKELSGKRLFVVDTLDVYKRQEDSRVSAFHVSVGRAVHRSDTTQRVLVVHDREQDVYKRQGQRPRVVLPANSCDNRSRMIAVPIEN